MENINLSLISGDLLKEIYGDFAKPSVQSVGKALGTVFDIVFGGLSYFPQKGNIYLKNNLERYRKKLENVPVDNIIIADPQIGVPIVEKLNYTTHEEISDLFTTLLANASISEKVVSVHPSFISIIEQLAPDEAKIIAHLSTNPTIPYCNINGSFYNDGAILQNSYNILIYHATDLPWQIDFYTKENIGAYLDNLVRLGILSDEKGTQIQEMSLYKDILEKYNYNHIKETLDTSVYRNVFIDKSFYALTDFGKLFIKACIKD